jgi:predicted secreted protein
MAFRGYYGGRGGTAGPRGSSNRKVNQGAYMLSSRISGLVSIALLVGFAPWAAAKDAQQSYDQINLSASASSEVDNDILTATLYYQKEGSDTAALSDEVNKNIAAAVKQAKQATGVKVQTLAYRSDPVYRQEKLWGWRVRQSIRLESNDVASLGALIGRLQANLALESIGYAISPEKQKAAEEKLIVEALDAFQKRAELVTRQLGRSKYRLVQVNVNTSDAPVRPVMMRASGMMAMEAASAPPALEAGTRSVQVTVNGTIELQLD